MHTSAAADGLVHKRTDRHLTPCQDRHAPYFGGSQMFSIVGVGIVLIAVAFVLRMRVRGGVNAANLGWMSQRWLAELRASHSPS
jgi:hypothetical protein